MPKNRLRAEKKSKHLPKNFPVSDNQKSMNGWKRRIENLIDRADKSLDKLRIGWRKRRGYRKPILIIPYLGYGTADKFLLRGRVVEDKGAIVSALTDTRRRNLANFYRRFATDEVPFARVLARYKTIEREFTADDEGYFHLELNTIEAETDEAFLQEIELELIEPLPKNGEKARAAGYVQVPPPTAKFGIISDIDDTVLYSNITNKLKMLLLVAFLNEHTRVPFKGVAAFYKALQNGADGAENNPIFYVSSSPWNLYAPLTEFLRIQNIPLGPLFLKDFGNHTIFNSGDHSTHKIESIELVLNTYPQLPFVLIGDSGEQDPEIYRQILQKYPNRIRVIYIRSVDPNPARVAAIDKLIAEIAETGCQLVLAPDTEFAATHAAAEKLISPQELPRIREEKRSDEATPKIEDIAENKDLVSE